MIILVSCQTTTKENQSKESKMSGSINLATLEGEPVNLSAFNTEIVILNIWATWCKPCIAEMPALVEMKKSLPDNMKLLLASEEPVDRQINFLEKRTYDLEFMKLNSSLSSLEVYALPTTIIIKEGKIIDRLVGARDWDTPEQIEELKAYLK